MRNILLFSAAALLLAFTTGSAYPQARSPVFTIPSGGSGTAANVAVGDGNGKQIPVFTLNGSAHSAAIAGTVDASNALVALSGAQTRTLAAVRGDTVNVADYRAPGDADWTQAFVRALAVGKTVVAPSARGPYAVHSGLINVSDGQTLRGEGDGGNGTVLQALDATGNVVTMTDNARVDNFYWGPASGVTRTAGCYVTMTGNTGRAVLTNYQMWSGFNGICSSANSIDVLHGKMFGMTNYLYDISAGFNLLIDDMYSATDPTKQPLACFHITQVGDITINHARATLCGEGLLADVGSGQYIGSLLVTNSFLDTSGVRGMHLRSNASGNIVRARFENLWTGNSMQEGVLIENNGTGHIADISFVNPTIEFNGKDGLKTVGAVDNLYLDMPTIGANGTGSQANPGSLAYTQPAAGAACGLNLSAGTELRMSNPLIGGTSEMGGNNCPLAAVSGTSGIVVGGKIAGNQNNINDASGAAGLRYIGVAGIGTDNRIQITIPSGTGTSGYTFNHNLTFPPSAGDWSLTIDSNPGSSGVSACWISAWNATTMTATCSATTTSALYATVAMQVKKGRAN